jgi:hypothetical protein
MSGFGVIGDVERQQAAVNRAATIISGVEQAAVENITPYVPAIDKLATGALAAADGRIEESMRQWTDGLALAVGTVGPVGVALASIFKLLTEGMLWLCKEFPARQVCCAGYLDTELPRQFGSIDIGVFYREEGWLYVSSMLMRSSKASSFSASMSDCFPSLPGGYFNASTDAGREEALKRLCAPRRVYRDAKPPGAGYKSWYEYEAFLKREGKFDAMQTELDAAAKIGDDVFSKLRDEGELRKFSFAMGDLCWAQGFAFKVRALPNHTLLNVIRKLLLLAPAEPKAGTERPSATVMDEVADVPEVVGMEEITYPDLPASTVILWVDQLADAIAYSFAASDQATYHMHALVTEYKRRLDAGTITKPGPARETPGQILARLPFLRSALASRLKLKIGTSLVSLKVLDPTWKTGESTPWYKSPWTYVVGVLVLGGGGYGIYRLTRRG